MPRTNWPTEIIVEHAREALRSLPCRVFSFTDAVELHSQLKRKREIPRKLTVRSFLQLLLEREAVKEILLNSKYEHFKRYVLSDASVYEIAQSLQKGSYLSHATAAFLNRLTDRETSTVYLNKEQSPKPRSGSLTQGALDKAFSRKQRQSSYVVQYEKSEIVLINGKNTGRLGVEQIEETDHKKLDVTNLERTLIDIVVRPAYSGGPSRVLQMFTTARDRVNVQSLLSMLQKIDYIYPYHQAIGFYMQKAGFQKQQLNELRAEGFMYDFYLAHGLENPTYNSEWRIYVPEELDGLR